MLHGLKKIQCWLLCDVDHAVFALSKLPLMQGPIDIQKQVRQNEEKRIYEPQPLMHLSPHFLASFTVYSWLANYEFYLKADPT